LFNFNLHIFTFFILGTSFNFGRMLLFSTNMFPNGQFLWWNKKKYCQNFKL
jgi:hypothetical protein